MTEAEEERVPEHYDTPTLHEHAHHHTEHALNGAEAYHRFLWHNKHVMLELKLAVLVLVGAVIILACLVYIALQCRARVRPAAPHPAAGNRRDDEKELFGSSDTLDNLIPAENSIRLKVRRDKEFFV